MRLGITRLPDDLGQAIRALKNDAVLLAALDDARAKTYLAVRSAEWLGLKELPFEEEVELLLERY